MLSYGSRFLSNGPRKSGLFRVECAQDSALSAKLNQLLTSLTWLSPYAPVKRLNRMFCLPQSHPALQPGVCIAASSRFVDLFSHEREALSNRP